MLSDDCFTVAGNRKITETKSTYAYHGKNAEEMPLTGSTVTAGSGLNGAQGSQKRKFMFNWNALGWLPRLTSIKVEQRLANRNRSDPKMGRGRKG